MLDERIGDYESNDADWARVPTLLNAESRGTRGRVCFRRSHWQGEVEGRARSVVGRHPHLSAMGLDDRAADRQSHAHAVGLGGEEGREQAIEVLGIDADA